MTHELTNPFGTYGLRQYAVMRVVWLAFATLVAALLIVTQSHALEVPKLEGRVNDRAGLLPPDAKARLEQKLEAHEKATGQQFAVLTLKSLEGDPLEDFSIRTVEAWKLGSEKNDEGLLLLVVKDDRKIRIEVGHGLEGSITDALSARLIRQEMAPHFKAGDYAGGIEAGIDRLIRHETPGAPQEIADRPPARHDGPPLGIVLALLLFLSPLLVPILLAGQKGRFGGRGRRGGFYGGFGGGFGGGSFGGGFGGSSGGGFSGGGGSFGGGGASGSW